MSGFPLLSISLTSTPLTVSHSLTLSLSNPNHAIDGLYLSTRKKWNIFSPSFLCSEKTEGFGERQRETEREEFVLCFSPLNLPSNLPPPFSSVISYFSISFYLSFLKFLFFLTLLGVCLPSLLLGRFVSPSESVCDRSNVSLFRHEAVGEVESLCPLQSDHLIRC